MGVESCSVRKPTGVVTGVGDLLMRMVTGESGSGFSWVVWYGIS